MEVNRKELYRYLGYVKEEPDADIKQLAEDCLAELIGAARPRFFYREYPLRLSEDGAVDAHCFSVRSRGLYRNLLGCERVILFAATLGTGVDLLIRRRSCLSVSRAVILQAAGTAAIEAFCDEENEKLETRYRERGCSLRPRFSPGYGDFPLELQRELIDALEAEKRVGITLTDRFIMVPSKSVTAVIGVEKWAADHAAGADRGGAKENCRSEEENSRDAKENCRSEEENSRDAKGNCRSEEEDSRDAEGNCRAAGTESESGNCAVGCRACKKSDCLYRKG